MTRSDRRWLDTTLPPRERAEALVAAMTLEEKIEQLHGAMETIDIYSLSNQINSTEMTAEEMEQLAAQIRIERHVSANDELGIPRFRITNGPVGVGMGDGTPSPPATSLPMTIALAAGFDPDLATEYGDIIGEEAAALGQHVLEGPGVCLHRTPTAGRNFEYFSEDPYLSGVMGVQVARAIQDHDVIAMAKHFVLNDQEYERFRANVEIEEDVLRELYLLPFEMLVKDAEIAAVMSAYNRIRGTYATENRYLLTDVLRKEWGFQGYVQSDFWSCRSCAAALSAGMDHEMPDAKWLNAANVGGALGDFSLEIETVDRALVRRFTQMFRFGQFERPYAPVPIDGARNGARSRRIGAQCAVLLKNEDAVLPLDARTAGSVLIVGQKTFVAQACLGGGGSSKVDPLYTVTPLEGMKDVLAALHSGATVRSFTVERDLSNLDAAIAEAKAADTLIIMAGTVATEGADRATIAMPDLQDQMISALLGIAGRTVVVLKDSSPVLMPWIDRAPAVLEAWNQGAEDGHVVADLLFGVVNPSGKVPTTYPRSEADTLTAGFPERYPGVDLGEGFPTMTYSEGRQVGYRWHQSQGIEPLFPFGHGLSYTTFAASPVSVTGADNDGTQPVTISLDLTNTGTRAGAEVIQVYLGVPGSGQPPQRLVGFTKVFLAPGESGTATVTIDPAATNHPLSVWSLEQREFVVPRGDFALFVGTSSEQVLHSGIISVR